MRRDRRGRLSPWAAYGSPHRRSLAQRTGSPMTARRPALAVVLIAGGDDDDLEQRR
jgi:hypothetical protein